MDNPLPWVPAWPPTPEETGSYGPEVWLQAGGWVKTNNTVKHLKIFTDQTTSERHWDTVNIKTTFPYDQANSIAFHPLCCITLFDTEYTDSLQQLSTMRYHLHYLTPLVHCWVDHRIPWCCPSRSPYSRDWWLCLCLVGRGGRGKNNNTEFTSVWVLVQSWTLLLARWFDWLAASGNSNHQLFTATKGNFNLSDRAFRQRTQTDTHPGWFWLDWPVIVHWEQNTMTRPPTWATLVFSLCQFYTESSNGKTRDA